MLNILTCYNKQVKTKAMLLSQAHKKKATAVCNHCQVRNAQKTASI